MKVLINIGMVALFYKQATFNDDHVDEDEEEPTLYYDHEQTPKIISIEGDQYEPEVHQLDFCLNLKFIN